MLKAVIKNIPLILALLTAGLFTFGLTFHQGYLEYWGLEESMFQLSFEKTLFQGFLTPHYFGVTLVLGVVVALAYLIMLLILLVSGWIWRKLVSGWIWRLDGWFDEQKDQEIPPHFKNPLRLILILSGVAAILIFIKLILLVVGILGENAATLQHMEFENIKELSITVIHKDKSELKGYSIICSETHCAFLVGEQVKVWPLSDISVIESEPSRKIRPNRIFYAKFVLENVKELLRDW